MRLPVTSDDSVAGMALLAVAIPVAVLSLAFPLVGACLLASAVSGAVVRRLAV